MQRLPVSVIPVGHGRVPIEGRPRTRGTAAPLCALRPVGEIMRHDKQVEASTSARRASIYAKIAAVIDSMPDRFKAVDLYKAAGIQNHNHPGHRMMIAAVMSQDFKCESIIQPGGKRYWRKPNAKPLPPTCPPCFANCRHLRDCPARKVAA